MCVCYDAHEVSNWHVNLYISSSFKSPLLHCHCSLSMLHIFLVSTPPFCLFRCFPIPSEPVLFPPMSKTFLRIHSTWAMDSTINHSTYTHAETVIYYHEINHYTYQIWQSSNLCHLLICDMNYYTHLYGSTVVNMNCIRSMVNLTLEAHVRYPFYIVICCKMSPLTC